jgi:hypothetical protein
MVGWMVEKDPKAFAALVRKLLHTSPSEPAQKALLEAVRSTFKHDLVSLVDAWSDAIKKSRAASAGR